MGPRREPDRAHQQQVVHQARGSREVRGCRVCTAVQHALLTNLGFCLPDLSHLGLPIIRTYRDGCSEIVSSRICHMGTSFTVCDVFSYVGIAAGGFNANVSVPGFL